jgi:pyruvate,water dikinase
MVFKFLRRFLKETEDEQVSLQKKFVHFRQLLEGNNRALETMADMEEKLSGDFLFDTGYLYSQVEQLGNAVPRMVSELNVLTQDRYRELAPICQNILQEIHRELAAVPTIPDTPYILPLSALDQDLTNAVGGKMANLGEIGNRIGLPVPQGFAITAAA